MGRTGGKTTRIKLAALTLVCLLSLTGCVQTQYKTITTGAPGVTKYLTTITDSAIGGGTHTITNTITNTVTNTVTTAINNGVTMTQVVQVPTTILTTVVMPPVTLPATTITTTITTTPVVIPTLANSVSLSVNPAIAALTEKTTQQIVPFTIHVVNAANIPFNLVKLTFLMQTQIPTGAITNSNNVMLNTLGYTWTLGVVTGGVYTFTGPATFSIPASGSFDFAATLYLSWNNPPPVGSYTLLSNVTASF